MIHDRQIEARAITIAVTNVKREMDAGNIVRAWEAIKELELLSHSHAKQLDTESK